MARISMFMVLCVSLFACMDTVDGKYRVAWITNSATGAGTTHWVGFKAWGPNREKHSDWMWPKKSFKYRGEYHYYDVDEPTIGDISEIEAHVYPYTAFKDDWNGYQVTLSDFDTKKVYEAWPGKVGTNKYKYLTATVRECNNNLNPGTDVAKACELVSGRTRCINGMSPSGTFNKAKTFFYRCLKACHLCFPPETRSKELPKDEGKKADKTKKREKKPAKSSRHV